MPLTTFRNEALIYHHHTGEALVQTDAHHRPGKQYVAVTADGFRTDYPFWDTVRTVRWDHPEWFTSEFVSIVGHIVKAWETQ